jgi:transposase-like protein
VSIRDGQWHFGWFWLGLAGSCAQPIVATMYAQDNNRMSSDSSLSEGARPKRVPVKEKQKAALRLLRGESAEQLARELDVSERRLLGWKQRFIEGGQAGLVQPEEPVSELTLARRKKFLLWAIVAGLCVVIWIVTRFLIGLRGTDED